MLFSNVYKDKTVLITGCTGFKGSWLALWLLEMGAKVIGLSLDPPSSPSHFESINLSKYIKDIRFDIRNFSPTQKFNNDGETKFHFPSSCSIFS